MADPPSTEGPSSLTSSTRTTVYLVPGPSGDRGGPDVAAAWRGQGAVVQVVDAGTDWWSTTTDGHAVVADVSWLPGPRIVERLLAAAAHRPDTVVDARVLPIETTRVGEPDPGAREDAVPRTHPSLRVSGACCLVPSGRLPEVGPLWRTGLDAGRAAALVDWARSSGVSVVVEPTATVVLPLRVDVEGSVLGLVEPADDRPFEPPADLHPAMLPATSVAVLIEALGLTPDPAPADPSGDRPFLSIVTRTQGTRRQCLADVLSCLAAQTNRDFELLVMCHRVAGATRPVITGLVAEQPDWLQERTRLLDVDRPGRTAPLNDGFEAAHGRYIAILDDDETVLAHWVETFARLERRGPGPLLRAIALRQDAAPMAADEDVYAVSVGDPFPAWAATFDLVEHLRVNHSPPLSVAFPRGVFHDLGVRFDESLPVNEDWDFIVRTAALVGARSAEEVTSVYRWWSSRESSRAVHDAAEWDDARDRILAKLDAMVVLLPPGSSSVARARHAAWTREVEEWRSTAESLGASQHEIIRQLDEVGSAHERTVAAYETMKERVVVAKRQTARAKRQLEALRKKLRRRTVRSRRHLMLMREADDLLQLTGSREQHASVFDMTMPQLQRLVEQLRGDGPESGSR